MKDGQKLSIFGPNGYLAEFSCDPSSFSDNCAKPEVSLRYEPLAGNLHLIMHNTGSTACTLQIKNSYDAVDIRHYTIAPGKTLEDRWSLAPDSRWFDISITQDSAPKFLRRFAGHVENGKPSTSDPSVFKET